MSAPSDLASDLGVRVEQYLDQRRHLGFELCSAENILRNFARFVTDVRHAGPLTVEVMAQWARQVQPRYLVNGRPNDDTAARRLAALRPFMGWLQQFEPATEVPDDSSFGRIPGRVTPHIYHEAEIVALIAAARQLGPADGLRAATYATLFGLIAASGLRISEALGLSDLDVDLDGGLLTIRQTKFGKSRLVPLHPSAVGPLATYRALRRQFVQPTPRATFFVSTRGVRRGDPLGDRQVHRTFMQLREQLGWIDRGAHGQPRVHDLRHSFAVRRLTLWHEHGADVDQRMLALSTYMGHAEISSTYWYLSAVPELMALAGARFERFADAGECDNE
jgi:integrase